MEELDEKEEEEMGRIFIFQSALIPSQYHKLNASDFHLLNRSIHRLYLRVQRDNNNITNLR